MICEIIWAFNRGNTPSLLAVAAAADTAGNRLVRATSKIFPTNFPTTTNAT